MKRISKFLSLVLCLATCGSIAACATPPAVNNNQNVQEEVDSSRTQLYVFNYGGGFGSDWLRAAKTRYEALHANDIYETDKKGVQVIIETKKAPLTSAEIKTSQNDVFFTEGVNYYSYYNDGALLDLTDALKKPLSDIDADDNKSVLDKFFPEQTAFYNTGTDAAPKYYAVPHYAAYYGLIYNVDLFDSRGYYFADDQSAYAESGDIVDKFVTKMNSKKAKGPDGVYNTSDDGLPTTYDEFFTLCDFIADEDHYIPIRWTGSNYRDYLNSLMNSLVVDYEGKANMMMNYTFTGTASNLGRVDANGNFVPDAAPTTITADNANELYRAQSRYEALKFLEKLCKDDAAHNKYHNDLAFNGDYSHMNAQEDFLYAGHDNGATTETAMLVDGVWWQMEAVSTFTDMVSSIGDEMAAKNRRFAFMPLPKANAAKAAAAASSTVKQTLFDAQYSAGFIRSTISDYKKDLALDFLRFVNTQESLVEYTQITSTTKALDYTLSATDKEKVTHFGKSLIELQEKSEIVYPIAKNTLYLNNASLFRPAQMYSCNVMHVEHQWAAEAFRDYGMTAAKYFEGMEAFYDNRWANL